MHISIQCTESHTDDAHTLFSVDRAVHNLPHHQPALWEVGQGLAAGNKNIVIDDVSLPTGVLTFK